MSEAEVVEQLIGYTDMLLVGLSLLFSVVSAYVAALHYFVRRANVMGRVFAFSFFLFVFTLLCGVLWGAQTTHAGLIAGLRQMHDAGALSVVGRSVLGNAELAAPGLERTSLAGVTLSIDSLVMFGVWGGLGITVVVLFVLTFVVDWGEREQRA